MKKITSLLLTAAMVAATIVIIPISKALDVNPPKPQGGILELFDMVNKYRVENGLPKLIWNDEISDVAQAHSENMHNRGEVNHYLSGKGPEDRLNEAGIKWSCYVENLAYNKGQPDKAAAAFDSWKKSDGHRKNMLDSCITEGAIGYEGCDMRGHYFTFMGIKPAGQTTITEDPYKIIVVQGATTTAKLTVSNTGDKAMTVKSEISIKPQGIRFGVGPSEITIDANSKGDFTVTIGAESAKVGTYNAEVVLSYEGGKIIYPIVITVNQASKTNTVKLWIGKTEYYINGEKAITNAPPTIYKNSAVVGARMIADIFGAQVDYNSASKTVTITTDSVTMIIQVGNTQAKVNGKAVTLSAPPVIIKGSLYVPLRFIVENLGGKVVYDTAAKMITITY